jgi:hypothetical protein
MPKLSRSPGLTYAWMACAVLFVIYLFAVWERFVARQRQGVWWLMLAVFLLFDYLFLIIPIRDSKSLRHLSRAGKLWAALAWLLVAAFVYAAIVGSRYRKLSWTTAGIATCSLLLLGLLVFAIYRLSREWIRESLRSIVARSGGGFLIRFQPDEVIAAVIAIIPGVQPVHDADAGSGGWSVPADPAAAAALLQFAKQFDFEFVPKPGGSLQEKISRAG